MKKTLIHITLLLLIFGCKSKKPTVVIEIEQVIHEEPPGTIQIADNLYIDKTEITNLSYLEYVEWTRNHFGKNSAVYKNCLPDTNVWSSLNINYSQHDSVYLRHRAYWDYPVVGVSFLQAQNFTNWRTERVVENWLIRKGKIADRGVVPADSVFTIEKYYAGEYYNYIPDNSIEYLPRYYLPDSNDYRQAVDFAKILNLKNYKSCRKKFCNEKLLIECNCLETKHYRTESKPFSPDPTSQTSCVFCKKDLITHLQGNVREFTSEEGKVFGSSFIDPCTEDWNQIRTQPSKPTCYTGFRNICVYEKVNKNDS